MVQTSVPIVFISYSHKDSRWLDDLRSMLSPLLRTGAIKVWWDGNIKPSAEWRREIDEALASARVAVLLVSRHFLASDFIVEMELRYLLQTAQTRKVKILWLLVSPCLHEHTALQEIQALNDIARPLSSLRGAAREHALKSACQVIAETAGFGTTTTRHRADRSTGQRTGSASHSAPARVSSEEARGFGAGGSVAPETSTSSFGGLALPLAQSESPQPSSLQSSQQRVHESREGCIRVFGSALIVVAAFMLYILLAVLITLPLAQIPTLRREVTPGNMMESLFWGCALAPLYYVLMAAALIHGIVVAVRAGGDNLMGAKICVVDVAVITILATIVQMIGSANRLALLPSLLGCLGALLVTLAIERWLARRLDHGASADH